MAFLDQLTRSSPTQSQGSILILPATQIGWRHWSLWLIGFGIFSMMIARDASFDVAHYHLHNGWAALNGRHGQDLAPAEMHSFLNPAWQVFLWYLIDNLPGRVVAFILGALQGLILPALYALTRRLLRAAGAQPSMVTVIALSVAGFLAETQFGLFGSVRNDAICALVFIASLALLVPQVGKTPSLKSLALASFMIGALTGIKLTNSVYVAGFAVAALIVVPDWKTRAKAAAVCAAAGLVGIMVFGGGWAWQMYNAYGNPVFPMMNSLFDAPLGPDIAFRDERYLPDGILDAVIRPFRFLLNGELIYEYDFFDLRFLLTYLGSFAILALALLSRLRNSQANIRPAIAIGAGMLVAILTWSALFSISRYIAAAWIIGPTILALVVALVRPSLLTSRRTPLAAIMASVLLFITTSPSEQRRVPWQNWSENYVTISLPGFDYSNSIIVFAGEYSGAFLAPAFPDTARSTHAVAQDWSAPALSNYRPLIRDLIAESGRDIQVVIVDAETHFERTLERLREQENLSVDHAACTIIETSFSSPGTSWKICPADIRQ